MQALAAEFFGWRRRIPLLFEQKGLKQVVWNVRLKKWLLNGRAASV
jgi:hypothetical protein